MNPSLRLKQIALVAGDICVLYAALAVTLLIRYGTLSGTPVVTSHFEPFSVLFSIWIIVFYINNLYDPRRLKNTAAFLAGLGAAIIANAMLSIIFFYLITDYGIAPKINLFIFLVAVSVLMYGWRSAYNTILKRRMSCTPTAILGETPITKEIQQAITDNPQLGYRLTDSVNRAELIIVPPSASNDPKIAAAIYQYAATGTEITDSATFYELIFKKLPIAELEPAWFVGHLANRRGIYDFIREPVEKIFAVALAILTLPLTLIIALLIRITSSGPVIFRQIRTGKFGKPFVLYKFRSMVTNAPDGSAEAGTGAIWKTENDPRFTRIGRILERTHLDELPQLINIIRGDASFVGPRPERPKFVTELTAKIPYYDLRHLVKPGIAGWAQLNYKYGASVEDAYEKLCYDLWYLKNRSLWLDSEIILKTIKLFVTKNP